MTNISESVEVQLQNLRSGDRLKYHGVQFEVKDYSTYRDDYGYETQEWLLSTNDTQYYLLREIDPENLERSVNWYLAEEIPNPSLFLPDSPNNIIESLAANMRTLTASYPEIQLFGKSYYFESWTKGNYVGEGEERSFRVTWDYWNRDRTSNLAIEAWANKQIYVYLSKIVNPEDFTQIKKALVSSGDSESSLDGDIILELIVASAFLITGLFMVAFS